MPYFRHVDKEGILITIFSKNLSLKEINKLQSELPDYACNGEIYELVIHPDDLETVLDRNEAVQSAMNIKRVMKGIKKGAIAYVASKDHVFGILRQLQMRVENEYIQMAVFRTKETAYKWLREMKTFNK